MKSGQGSYEIKTLQLPVDSVIALKYLEDLEHIFYTGKNVLNRFLLEISRINKV